MKSKITRQNTGFTIVELLVVVVVIAILATIAVVSYGAISNRAKDSALASEAASIEKAALVHQTLNNTFGVVGTPTTKTDVLTQYSAGNLVDKTTVCAMRYNPDTDKMIVYYVDSACDGESADYPKDKVVVVINDAYGYPYIVISYWSNADQLWHYKAHSDGPYPDQGTSPDRPWGLYGTS